MPRKRSRGPRTPELDALGQALERSRKKAGLSQEALCEKTGLYPTHISSLERGQRNPTYLTLIVIANGLGTTASKLIERAERIQAQMPMEDEA